jgi:hypothetical protein
MTDGDSDEDVSQIPERIDVVEFACLDQRGNGAPMFSTAVRTCEQSIFPIERYQPFILPMSGRK